MQIGVNNQFQNLPFDQFKSELNELLNTAIGIAGNKEQVFVLSIPDYGVTPFGSNNSEVIAKEIDNYNNYILQLCNQRGIVYFDVTTISRTLGDNPVALASDGLHPSGYQYSQWIDSYFDELTILIDKYLNKDTP